MMRKFAAAKVEDIIRSIPMPVYLPIEKDGLVQYGVYEEGVKLNLDTCKTEKSPKDAFFPQCEDMMSFRMEGKSIEVKDVDRCTEDFVLFGIHACDIKAFELLDKVFLADPVDTYYAARRAHGIIVGLACGNPEETCFCSTFGIDASQPNADVVLWKVGEEYYAESYTDRGAELMESWATEEAGTAPVEAAKKEITEKIEKLPFAHLDLTGIDGDHLNEIFNSPAWEKLSMACLGCGSCTFACPTCQCYDIRDYENGRGEVQRYRCWDSCMYSDFTMMAHGTNRPTQMQRYRQRFMHKLVYTEANFGMYSCVGCGRCVNKCPMNLNIVKVIKTLGEANR